MTKKKKVLETSEQLTLRLSQVFPYTWEALQLTLFPDTIWEKVNATDSDIIGPHVDALEDAANALSKQLRMKPKQAALIIIETCFQRLE
ncbi:hypothetical protein KSF_107750 [Reticulibacter mediterranei]|uniref:Uncharacterized protein n=1 Tax=Reticulibacter mediterranei TaxID=2778369 RepID=A0A8J3NAT0_9CHLR|nr:hypothetical protein [Reticulibacter mediterranei]GHP00728.1 hypothetical protein KSF_107750 [Reticulibacter mediterranei]